MLESEISNLIARGLDRRITDRLSAQGARILLGVKEVVNFSSNDYLGLASHPEITGSAQEALRRFGFGSGASRLLAGGSVLHHELEERVAQFKNTETSLIFNSGYSANAGIIPALVREDDAIFSDELNHASIIDGCRLSKAGTFIYRHRDVGHLEELLKRDASKHTKKKKTVVITDAVFSMDGDIAPLPDIAAVCERHGALLYVDDAHGTGVLGNGRGALAGFSIKPQPWIIQIGTFSKAFGSYGGFVAGSHEVIRWIQNTARSFIFSTALPACVAAASLRALEIVDKDPSIVEHLWENRDLLFQGLAKLGYRTTSETPILPLLLPTTEKAAGAAAILLEQGIYVPAIRPPSVKEPRLRITVTAAHTEEDIGLLIDALEEISRRF